MKKSFKLQIFLGMSIILLGCSDSNDSGSISLEKVSRDYCDYIDECPNAVTSMSKKECLAQIENQPDLTEETVPCGSQMIAMYTCVTGIKCDTWRNESKKYEQCEKDYPNDDDERERCQNALYENRLCGNEFASYQTCLQSLKN